jgi:hypothetical protein
MTAASNAFARAAVAGLLLLAACAAPGPTPRAEDFPFHDLQQGFALHWRIERGEREVTALGLLDPGILPFQYALLGLFGLDGQGRTVTRGTETVSPWGLSPAPTPFAVRAQSAGGEASFRVVIVAFEREIRPDP